MTIAKNGPRTTRPWESIIAAAHRAPSSHNTQPWRFVTSPDQVTLRADRSRSLPVNDPADRELTISCGAALFNLVVAAEHAGVEPRISRLPEPDDRDVLAHIRLAGSPGSIEEPSGLMAAIERRHTTRRAFRSDPVPGAVVAALEHIAGAHEVWIEPIAAGRRSGVAELVAAGDRAQFGDRAWRRELAQWMRHPRHGDGLPARGVGGPAARVAVRRFDLGAATARKDLALAESAPLMVALGTTEDDPLSWIRAGEALEHLLLQAAAFGIQGGFLNQPCQVSSLRRSLAEELDHDGHPQLLVRLGQPTATLTASPRRPLEVVAVAEVTPR